MSSLIHHSMLADLIRSHPDWPIIQSANPSLNLDHSSISCRRLIAHYLAIEVIHNPSWVDNCWKGCKPLLNISIKLHVSSIPAAPSTWKPSKRRTQSGYKPQAGYQPTAHPIPAITPSAIEDLIANDPFKAVPITKPIATSSLPTPIPPSVTANILSGLPSDYVSPSEATIADTSEAESEDDTLTLLANQVLSPIKPFAAPSVLQAMEQSLATLLDHAHKAIEDAHTASSNSSLPLPIPTIPTALQGTLQPLAKAFGIPSSKSPWASLPVTIWASPSTPILPIDPAYVHDVQTLGLILSATERGTNVWLWGPKGSGKTELSMQIAARLNRPYVRVPFADDMDKYALIGQRYPSPDGNGKWHDGILSAAIRVPGTVVALDEPTLAKPGTLAVIQTLIDTRRLSIEETGEVVDVANGVTFIALDNTSGFGDETGRYSGTGVMNEAFLNRFPRKIEIDRMDSSMVVQIIAARTNLKSPAACDELAKLLRLSEDCARNGKTSTHLSLRDILCFAQDLAQGLPAQACMDATLLAALPPTEREAFRQNVLAHGMPLDQLSALALNRTHTTKGN